MPIRSYAVLGGRGSSHDEAEYTGRPPTLFPTLALCPESLGCSSKVLLLLGFLCSNPRNLPRDTRRGLAFQLVRPSLIVASTSSPLSSRIRRHACARNATASKTSARHLPRPRLQVWLLLQPVARARLAELTETSRVVMYFRTTQKMSNRTSGSEASPGITCTSLNLLMFRSSAHRMTPITLMKRRKSQTGVRARPRNHQIRPRLLHMLRMSRTATRTP